METCKYFDVCGGCQLNLPYEEQIRLKTNYLKNLYGYEPKKIFKSPKTKYYRNRMDFVVGKEYKIGLRELGKWWKIIDIEECFLMSKESDEIKNQFREYIKENKLEPYDLRKHIGYIRYLVIREGKFTGDRQVQIIVSNETYLDKFNRFFEQISDLANSFYIGINSSKGDTSYAENYYLIGGKKYIKETINNITYLIGPNTFFQANSYTAKIMCDLIKSLLSGGKILYDLYSGIGLFSLQLYDMYDKIFGVEVNKNSVELLNENASLNDITNVEGIYSKVEDLKSLEGDLIIDPPRSGLHPKVIKTLVKNKNKIDKLIYVSCNPKTHKRDIDKLKECFEMEKYYFIDQFPRTNHIEIVSILIPK